MNFAISAVTDVGIRKKTNQDSLSVQTLNTSQGKMTLAVLCDGMGGLSKGEVASAAVIGAFQDWLRNELPELVQDRIEADVIKRQWVKLITDSNQNIKNYGERFGISLGTTVVAMLITQEQYFLINVGDSRAYEISDGTYQLTYDQTFVAREIAEGRMTVEEAKTHPKRNMLLQCCGASETVVPDFFVGRTAKNCTYMLCSDGFRHVITPDELYQMLNPNVLTDETIMHENATQLVELNKHRLEQDNISVVLIRTY